MDYYFSLVSLVHANRKDLGVFSLQKAFQNHSDFSQRGTEPRLTPFSSQRERERESLNSVCLMEAEPQLLPVVYTLDYSNRSYMLSLFLSLSQLNSSASNATIAAFKSSWKVPFRKLRSHNYHVNTLNRFRFYLEFFVRQQQSDKQSMYIRCLINASSKQFNLQGNDAQF